MKSNKDKVIEYLEACTEPQGIQTIQKGTGISHWNATLSICLELMVQGKIKGTKTSKSWVFWVDNVRKAPPFGGEILATV